MADKTIDEKLDAIGAHLDSLHKRMDDADKERADSVKRVDAACAKMDAFEKAKADADEKEKEEKEKADAARKDAEDKAKADAEEKAKADKARADAEEEEKKKADAAKADAAARADSGEYLKKLQDQIDALTRSTPAALRDEDKPRFADVQMRCDAAYQAWGSPATPALNGESFTDYRVRLLSGIKKHSKVYKDSNLAILAADEAAFSVIQDSIIADAIAASNSAVNAGGPLQKRVRKTESGHIETRFVGDPRVGWAEFSGGATKFGRINAGIRR